MDACAASVARAAARLHEPVELIIVDDRDVPAAARRPAHDDLDGLPVRRLWTRDAGVRGNAPGRNLGAVVASYDVLALIDDDALADPDWLAVGVGRLRADDSLAGVEGAVRVNLESPVDPVRSRIVANYRGGAYLNASMFYRAAAYRAAGGSRLMWHRPPTVYREDTELALRIERFAGPIVFEPDAFVTHPAEPVSLTRLVRLGRAFAADAVLVRIHPGVFGSVVQQPLARLRIRLATLLTLLLPGLALARVRRASAIAIATGAGAISAQFEVEIRGAGMKRTPLAIALDTVRRLPRSLVWAVAAGSGRLLGEAMVIIGLVEIPPERPPALPNPACAGKPSDS
jgi:hypothetical protein